jgi:hypothetical protein
MHGNIVVSWHLVINGLKNFLSFYSSNSKHNVIVK